MTVRSAIARWSERSDRPPMLPAPDLSGHLRAMNRDPIAVLARARRECGDVVRLRMGPITINAVFHPDYVHHILVTRRQHYLKSTRGYHLLRLMLGEGLVTSEGELWKRQRRIAQPAFHKGCIASLSQVMSRAALDLCDEWRHGAGVLDVAEAMSKLTLRIAGETLFGLDISGESDVVGRSLTIALHHIHDLASSLWPFPHRLPTRANRRFRRAIATIDGVAERIIAERREMDEQVTDLLGMMMAAEDPETGERMDDRQLRDEVFTMLLAGHETTATACSWALGLLARHPDAARRVEAEVDDVLDGGPAGMAHVRELTYTEQVLNEAMRLYPPVWMLGRRAAVEDEIGGYRIPRGAFVYTSQYVVHRHPDFWEDPDRFDPDRFSAERLAAQKALGRPRLAFFPFSGGQRKCIGDHFAVTEALIILATLLHRFRFSALPGHRLEPSPNLTLRPKGGLPMRVETR